MEAQPNHLHAHRTVSANTLFGLDAEGGDATPDRGVVSPAEVRRRRMLSRFAPPPPAERGDHPDIRAIARIEVLAGELHSARRAGDMDLFASTLAELAEHLPEVAATNGVAAPVVQHQIGLEPGDELEHLAECLDEAHTRIAELEAELAAARLAPWETPVGPPIGPAPTGEFGPTEEVSSDG